MSLPEPVYALTGHCSVVHENTLYVYSPEGFQSLDLEEGAEWKKLPMDIAVADGRCVKAVPGGDANAAKLYIVGGTVNETASGWDYPGLMHYSFADKKWDWVRPADYSATQNRKNHAATYLDESRSLLIFSGNKQGEAENYSAETFLIPIDAPYRPETQVSADVPPSKNPQLLPWGDGKTAVMVGGSEWNQAVYLFSKEGGWRNVGVGLTEPIPDHRTTQCALVSGDDGSKVLARFNMAASPNQVSRVVLLNPGGTVAAPGTLVGQKTKRLSVSDWPAYNATLAPTAPRTGYSLAQDDEGRVFFAGGSQEEPLAMFDQQENAWMNATEFFVGTDQEVLKESTSTSSASESATSTTSDTATPSASATEVPPVAATPVDHKSRTLTVLGATLGAIFGIAAILILLLLCLKYRKAKNKKTQQSGYIEKTGGNDRLSFADRGVGAEFMKEAGGTVITPYNHKHSDSKTSIAIISGRTGMNHKRGLGPLGSDASTAGLIKKGYQEPVELSKFDLKPEPREDTVVRQNSGRAVKKGTDLLGRSRSSGWSKYFANNDATNLAVAEPADRSTYASDRTSTGSQSQYTESRMLSQAIPPLQIPKFDNERISIVATGSPTLGHSQENLPAHHIQPMQAELGRADSTASTRSAHSSYNYHSQAPVHAWTPVGDSERHVERPLDQRPPSSTYTNSFIGERTSSYYADGTSSYYPQSSYTQFSGADGPGSGPPKLTDYGLPPKLGGAGARDRESTVTVFPRGDDRQTGGDMSWLNLGAAK